MKGSILFLILLILGVRCSNEREKEYFYDSGELKSRLTFPNKKDTLNYHQNDFHLTGEKQCSFDVKDGKLDGDFYMYYKTGRLSDKGRFLNGNPEGIYQQFDSIGRLIRESYFVNNSEILYSEGLESNDGKYFKQLFHVVLNDTIYPIGALIWKGDTIQTDLSHYAIIIGEDTLRSSNYSLQLHIHTIEKSVAQYEITFGKPDTELEFDEIDTSFFSKSSVISLNNLRLHQGHNSIFGRIYVYSSDTSSFYVYKDVYVSDKRNGFQSE